MALVTCKECMKQISDSAKTCPNCGFKVANGMGVGSVILIAIVVLFVISAIVRNPDASNSTQADNDSAKAAMAKIGVECMHEAGIPDGQPDYRVSPNQLEIVAECTDRKMKY
jgi:zinc-ribbon domain